MNKIKAILVDDEEGARDVLQNLLLRFCPEIELVTKCGNVEEAVHVINYAKPDLVFLDIEMSNYAGYEIVNFFSEINFKIIFVTAYDNYAIRAFEIAAIDYLLKPIDINRLKLAVERVSKQKNIEQQAQRLSLLSQTLKEKQLKNIVISDKGQQNIISVDSIIAIEAQESYCSIYSTDKKITASKNLKYFEKIFSELPQFFRVHKSWLINIKYIVNYSKSELEINLTDSIKAKLSKYKKIEFETLIVS